MFPFCILDREREIKRKTGLNRGGKDSCGGGVFQIVAYLGAWSASVGPTEAGPGHYLQLYLAGLFCDLKEPYIKQNVQSPCSIPPPQAWFLALSNFRGFAIEKASLLLL